MNKPLANSVAQSPPPSVSSSRTSGTGSIGEFANSIVAALMCSVMAIVFALADASLLFGSALSQHLPVAVSMTMISAVVLALSVALLSGFQGVIAGAQEASIVVLATMVAGIHASMSAVGDISESAIVATVVASVVLSTISLGLGFWVVGQLRLGRFIRYIPFPVITGFLAGAGILLIKYGIELAIGFSLSTTSLTNVFTASVLAKLGAMVVMVCLLFWASGEQRSRYAITLMVIMGVVVFLGVVLASGTGTSSWLDKDWMLTRSAQNAVYPPLQFSDLGLINWSVVASQVPQFGILVVISITAALVKINALEVILRTDVDQEKELKAVGYGNLVTGLFGGTGGFHTLSLTQIVKRMQTEYRLVGILVSLITLVAFVFSADLLQYMPRFVFAGIVVWIGVDMVIDFLLKPMKTLKPLEIAIIVLMTIIILFFGFIPAMIFGVVAGAFLFIIDFSRIDVVRQRYTGRDIHSNVDRPGKILQILYEHGDELRAFRIHGFLFFGTSYRLVQQIRNYLSASDAQAAKYLLIDFENVVRIDTSARVSLSRLGAFADTRGLTFLISGARDDVKVALEAALCADDDYRSPQFFETFDRALEWYEHWQLNDQRVGAEFGKRVGLHEWIGFDFDEQLMSEMFKYVTIRQLAAEEILFSTGNLTDGIYLVQHGSLDIVVNTEKAGSVRLRKVGPGAILGEVSLYLNQPASANVVAREYSEILHFTREQLVAMLAEHPTLAAHFHERMARVMAYRLSDNSRLFQVWRDS